MVLFFLSIFCVNSGFSNDGLKQEVKDMKIKDFYSFEARSLQGENISMEKYRGKVLLIVNTASECGFTPQYGGLQKLYEKYKDKGFEILGFPCNQFGKQEPGSNEDIGKGCVINYGVTFQMFEKIEVNGENAHPIYKFLKESLSGMFGKRIKWNFTKFLIDRNGNPVKRIKSISKPKSIEKYIEKLID